MRTFWLNGYDKTAKEAHVHLSPKYSTLSDPPRIEPMFTEAVSNDRECLVVLDSPEPPRQPCVNHANYTEVLNPQPEVTITPSDVATAQSEVSASQHHLTPTTMRKTGNLSDPSSSPTHAKLILVQELQKNGISQQC